MNFNDLNNLRQLDSDIREQVRVIEEEKRKLDGKIAKLLRRKREALDYISKIEDPQTRQIIFLRYIKGMSWGQVAIKIGGGNTSSGVRKRAARYIQAHEDTD